MFFLQRIRFFKYLFFGNIHISFQQISHNRFISKYEPENMYNNLFMNRMRKFFVYFTEKI